MLVEDGGEDAASVASDASTVVPEPALAAEEGESARAAVQLPAALQLPASSAGHACAAPEPQQCASPLLGEGGAGWTERAQQRCSLGASAASELFQSAASQLPALDGSSEGPLFGGLPPRRSSLSPAASSAGRRSSLATPLAQTAQPESSSLGATALSEGLPALAPAAAAEPEPAAAAAARASQSAGPLPAPEGSLGSASSRGLAAEASRASLASSSLTAAPSLRIEFAEASLRYSCEPLRPAPAAPCKLLRRCVVSSPHGLAGGRAASRACLRMPPALICCVAS